MRPWIHGEILHCSLCVERADVGTQETTNVLAIGAQRQAWPRSQALSQFETGTVLCRVSLLRTEPYFPRHTPELQGIPNNSERLPHPPISP